MSTLELRPLSTGEILDRTFTLYRRHFPLFIGLAALPRLPALAVNLVQLRWSSEEVGLFTTAAVILLLYLLILIGYL